MASLALPTPPSWYPGHMRQFMRNLPAYLSRTDVVLELRDARLPLTSINTTFEGALRKWQHERWKLAQAFNSSSQQSSASRGPSLRGHSSLVCERIIVMNKRDLVPDWGIEPYKRAIASKFSDQQTIFASWNRPRDVKSLHETIVNIAKENAHVSNELNVLVVGMPNVGKSTLLNALRNMGIPGPTPKALRTSASPGLTRALSTRLKLSQDPLVYSFDSPGVMLPFLGKGTLGAERGIKLALIAGIREGLYSDETLAEYLLYRLNLLNPATPAYLSVFPPGTPPTDDVYDFLGMLARRLHMLKRGGGCDTERAAAWFIRWWREEGCALSANAPFLGQPLPGPPESGQASEPADSALLHQASGAQSGGWGFDFQWKLSAADLASVDTSDGGAQLIQREMERVIGEFTERVESEIKEGENVSATQQKKRDKKERQAKRERRIQEMLARRRSGKS
ncbi:MTG1 [Sanghuangporus weigelae]